MPIDDLTIRGDRNGADTQKLDQESNTWEVGFYD